LLTKPSVNNFQKPVRKFKQKKQLVIGESAPFLSREVTFVYFIGRCPIFKVVLLIRYVPSWSYKKLWVEASSGETTKRVTLIALFQAFCIFRYTTFMTKETVDTM